MKNRFNMFNIEIYKYKHNLEIFIYKKYSLVIEYLDGGMIYYNVKNDIPFTFNRLRFERKQKSLERGIMNEIDDI